MRISILLLNKEKHENIYNSKKNCWNNINFSTRQNRIHEALNAWWISKLLRKTFNFNYVSLGSSNKRSRWRDFVGLKFCFRKKFVGTSNNRKSFVRKFSSCSHRILTFYSMISFLVNAILKLQRETNNFMKSLHFTRNSFQLKLIYFLCYIMAKC